MAPTEPPDPLQAQRLKKARLRRGFKSARAAALYFGWSYDSYNQHERATRGLRNVAKRYAKALRVSLPWLLTGEGDPGWGPANDLPAAARPQLTVDPDDLHKVVSLVLRSEGAEAEHADDLAGIVVECLSAPPLSSLGGDPFRSFEVRFELRSQLSSRSGEQ